MSLERKSLGPGCRALVVFLTLSTVVLVAGSVPALRAKYVADERRQATLETLSKVVGTFKSTEMEMVRS